MELATDGVPDLGVCVISLGGNGVFVMYLDSRGLMRFYGRSDQFTAVCFQQPRNPPSLWVLDYFSYTKISCFVKYLPE